MAHAADFSEFPLIGAESRWFTVWQIAPNVKAIFEPHHFQEVISYLIEGETGAVLFDSGMGIGNMKALVESLTDKPITLVCSHGHFDHVGGAWQFGGAHKLCTPDSVAEAAEGFSLPADDENRSLAAFSIVGTLWFDPKTFRVKPYKVIPAKEGEVFDLSGRRLRVVASPGHSDDGMMLADDENRLLFTGDTVYPGPLYAHLSGEHGAEVYRRTLEKLAPEFGSYTLLCSHNAPVMEGAALAEMAEAFSAIERGDVSGYEYMRHRRYDFDGFSIVM